MNNITEAVRNSVPSPQKIVPSPRKFTEDPLCDVQEPSERSRHTCDTSLESSMLFSDGTFQRLQFLGRIREIRVVLDLLNDAADRCYGLCIGGLFALCCS